MCPHPAWVEFFSAVERKPMKTTRLQVSGMSCGHCASTVESALRSRPGVRNAKVHLGDGAAEVEYDETSVAPEQLIAAIEDVGYGATFAGK